MSARIPKTAQFIQRKLTCLGKGLTLAEGRRKHRSLRRPMPFIGLVTVAIAGVNYAVLHDAPILACLESDSWGYVTRNIMRTQGYQLFASGVVLLFGDLRWIGPVQLNLMLASYAAIAFAVRRLFKSDLAGIAIALALMFSAQLYEFYPKVLTEALFTALIGFHLAAVILLLDAYSDWWTATAGLTVAALVLLRPNGVSFVLGIPVLAILLPRYWRRILLLGVAPVVVAVLAQATSNYYQQGFFGMTLFQGPSLVATYGELITGDMPTEYPGLAAALENRLRPLYAQYPRPAERSFPFEYAAVATDTVVPAQYVYAWPEMDSYVDRLMPGADSIAKNVMVDRIGTSIALSAIAHDPLGFAKDVFSSYATYWAKNSLQVTSGLNHLIAVCYSNSTRLIDEQPEPFAQMMDLAQYRQQENLGMVARAESAGPRLIDLPWQQLAASFHVVYVFRAVVFLVSTGAVLALVFRHPLSGVSALLAYLGVMLHAGYLVLSLGNASFQRYGAPLDPAMMLVLVTVLLVLYDYLAPRIPRSRTVEPGV